RCGEVFRIEKVENGLFYFKPKIAGNNIASLYSVSPYDVWFTNEYGQILLDNYLGKIVRLREPYYYEEGVWFKRRVYFKNDCVEITHVKPSGKIKRGDIEDGVIGFKCEGGKSYDFGEGIQSTYPGLVTIVEDEQPHKVKEGKCPSVL